ncbi:MAG: phosphatase PAP2 family protein [Bacteroidales bacterium]|nr:phosphatase PAP2 family protein [Candidatus Cryptobacteroides aphodequi]
MRIKSALSAIALLLCLNAAAELNENKHVETWTQYAPAVVDLALPLTGVQSNVCFGDRAVKMTTAYIFQASINAILKSTVDEVRPDGRAHNSFPSGHTGTAFVGAELVRQDYGWGWGAGAYAVATFTGTMRVVHNRHWWWDAAAGAALGIGSSLAAEALLPYLHEWIVEPIGSLFGKGGGNVAILPQYDCISGATLPCIAIRF